MAGDRGRSDPPDSTVWLGVAVVGVFVFILGIWVPAFAHVPLAYRTAVEAVVAAGGGALFVLGLSYWYDAREAERKGKPKPRALTGRAREIAIAPSFEVYDPKILPRPEPLPRLPEPPDAEERSP